MNPDVHYHYRLVGEPLIDELMLHVTNGESLFLLGHQGCGKRHVLFSLGKRLDKEERPHLSVFFRDNMLLLSEADVLAALKPKGEGRLRHTGCDDIIEELRGASSLADWFRRLAGVCKGRRLPMSFANIDWLADPLKERLLVHIRAAVHEGHLTAVVTGENMIARTLGKVTSPFQCALQYVLQGHDHESTRIFFMRRVEACGLVFVDPQDKSWNADTAYEALYEHTGGNIPILRAILWCLSERRMRFHSDAKKHEGYGRGCIQKSFFDYTSVPLFGLKLFHPVKSLILQAPEVLQRLELLLDQIHAARAGGADFREACLAAEIPVVALAPDALEIAGFLVRDTIGKVLRFPSFYVAEFATGYFSWKCRGDFHAKDGQWERAWECYRKMEKPESRQRPLGEQDYQALRVIVNRLCRAFMETITKEDATAVLRENLATALPLLFGLVSARVLRRGGNGRWAYEDDNGGELPDPHTLVVAMLKSKAKTTRGDEAHKNYCLHLDDPAGRKLLALTRPLVKELSPPHAVLIEAHPNGPPISGLRLRLLETVTTSFLTCLNEARLRRRFQHSRLELGKAVQSLFEKETVRESIEALGEYMHRAFQANGVRLFLIDAQTGHLKSAKSWGFTNEQLKMKFDAGDLVLVKGRDDELMRCLSEKREIAYRWVPKKRKIPRVDTDLVFQTVDENAYYTKVERDPGDFWIDFPLFIGTESFGKVTIAFPSSSPPPEKLMEDLRVISEILTHHLRRLQLDEVRKAEMLTLQQRAVAVTAHDLATRIASLPIYLQDYRDLEENLKGGPLEELKRINECFEARLNSAMQTLEQAKLRLSEVLPVRSRFDLLGVIREALRSVDPLKGGTTVLPAQASNDGDVWINADPQHISGVFLELVSDSVTMFPSTHGLKITVSVRAERDDVVIDYQDNGPGVPDDIKTRIFDYLVSYRPGHKRKGLGLGLGYVREALRAHGGSIAEIGRYGSGAHFQIKLPNQTT